MEKRGCQKTVLFLALLLVLVPVVRGGDEIPKAAWKRPIGLPLANPGTKKTTLPASTLTTDSGRARPSEALAPALFHAPIAAISPAGT